MDLGIRSGNKRWKSCIKVKQARKNRAKMVLTVFFDYSRVMHYEYYLIVRRCLREFLVFALLVWAIASSRAFYFQTQSMSLHNRSIQLIYPHANFSFFLNLKERFGDNVLTTSIEKIQRELQKALKVIQLWQMFQGFQRLAKKRWHKCI